MVNFDFFATSGLLKSTKRKGWVIRGVNDPESVADHMFQMGLICLAYPWTNEADRSKAVAMAIIHDAPEAISGDIVPSDNISPEMKRLRESLGLQYLGCLARNGGNPQLADQIQELWDEYEEGESRIAKVVHQVDKLEALQQAFIYAVRYPECDLSDFKGHRGYISDPWLSKEADDVCRKWDVHETRVRSSLAIIFVIGGPGAGKGTQCRLAAEQFGLEHISVGDLLRAEERSPESPFKEFISSSFHHSVVVPAALTMLLLDGKLERAKAQNKTGILLDGFPRSEEQLQTFREQISTRYATIVIDCPEDTLVSRLLSRAGSSGRGDDAPCLIENRVQTLRKGQDAMVRLLSQGWLRKISGNADIQVVQTRFGNAVQDAIRETM